MHQHLVYGGPLWLAWREQGGDEGQDLRWKGNMGQYYGWDGVPLEGCLLSGDLS